MQLKLICVGKVKESYVNEGIKEYIKRISAYAKVEIVEVSEGKIPTNFSDKDIEKVKEIEGNNILKNIKQNDYVIALDLHGKELTSEEFAECLSRNIDKYSNSIVFVIAGSYGYGNNVLDRANDRISLSKLTFLHQMTRFIFLEQIYRAFKIINNETYHK